MSQKLKNYTKKIVILAKKPKSELEKRIEVLEKKVK